MKVYQFKWLAHSFDQECNIKVSSEEVAYKIFQKHVVGDGVRYLKDAVRCVNLSKIYKKKYIRENIHIHYTEKENA